MCLGTCALSRMSRAKERFKDTLLLSKTQAWNAPGMAVSREVHKQLICQESVKEQTSETNTFSSYSLY